MAIDLITGLDTDIKVHNPTIKKELSNKEETPLKPPAITQEVNDLDVLKQMAGVRSNKSSNIGQPFGGISESKYNGNISQFDVRAGRLNQIRASNQPFHHEAANAGIRLLAEIAGGTIESIGITQDLLTGKVLSFDSENALKDLGETIKNSSSEAFQIYNADPGYMFSSSENFFENIVSLGTTLSLLIPTTGALKLVGGIGKIMKATSRGSKILNGLKQAKLLPSTIQGQWIASGVGQAVYSRQLESVMESSELYKQALEEGLTEEQAKEAATNAYVANLVMLFQDIPQYLALGKVFNPVTGNFVKNTSKVKNIIFNNKELNKYLEKAGTIGLTMGSEAIEEAYQYLVSEESMYRAKFNAGLEDYSTFENRADEYFTSSEFWNSVTMGALGGGVFQGVGSAIQNKANQKRNQIREEQYIKSRGILMNSLLNDIQEADKTGDPEKQKLARQRSNVLMVQEALLNDKYEAHLEYLESLANSTPEEHAQLQQALTESLPPGMEPGQLTTEVIKEVIPQLIKDSENIRNQYYKNINKYGQKIGSAITPLQFERDTLLGKLEAQRNKITEAETKIANLSELTPEGRVRFDTASNILAKEVATSIQTIAIYNNSNLSKAQKEEQVEKLNKEKEDFIKEESSKLNELSEKVDAKDKKVLDKIKEIQKNKNKEQGESPIFKHALEKANLELAETQLDKLDNEIKDLTSSKGEEKLKLQEDKNQIRYGFNTGKNDEDLEALKEFEKTKKTDPKYNELKNEFDKRKKDLQEKVEDDVIFIAEKFAENPNDSFEEGLEKLTDAEKEFANKYKSQIEEALEEIKSESLPPSPNINTGETSEETPSVIIEDKDVSPVVSRENLPNYVEWSESPINKSGYTAVVTWEKNNKEYPNSLKVTFLDKQGNKVTHNGEEVFTYIAENTKSVEIKNFRDKAFALMNKNKTNVVNVTVKGQLSKFAKYETINENNINEVFGNDPLIVYRTDDGLLVEANKESPNIAQTKNSGSGKKTGEGNLYVVVKDFNGDSVEVKLNRKKLKDFPGAIELIYQIYKYQLENGVSAMNNTVPNELLNLFDLLPKSAYKNKDGDITYNSVLDTLVYQSQDTNIPGTHRLFGTKNKVVYAENKRTLTKDNINNPEVKADFIQWLGDTKRINIKVKKNQEYMDAVISNKLLNTEKEKGRIFTPIGEKTKDGKLDLSNALYLDPNTMKVPYTSADALFESLPEAGTIPTAEQVNSAETPQSNTEAKKAEIEEQTFTNSEELFDNKVTKSNPNVNEVKESQKPTSSKPKIKPPSGTLFSKMSPKKGNPINRKCD